MTDNIDTPEDMRALWCAVIAQALKDAHGANSLTHGVEANAAHNWLLDMTPDFIEVCSLAGLDPDAVRESAKRILATPKVRKKPHHAPKPGVGKNLSASKGTGGGRHAQDISELEFSE